MPDLTKSSCIIVTGSIAYDDIMNFPGYFKDHFHPEKLHQINISFVVDRLDKHLGGTATNIAFNITRITGKKTVILGAMGKDHKNLTDFYDECGIDYSGCIIDKKLYTSTGKVMTDRADNQIWSYYYGAGARGKDVRFEKFAENSFVILSANHADAFLHAQTYCIEHSVPYLYDPGMSLTWIDDERLEQGVRHAAFVVGNDYEIAQMERRLKKQLIDVVPKGCGVITTLGAEGVMYQSSSEKHEVKAFTIKGFVDPTGAGDAWRGGFVAALAEGKTLRESLSFGNALASFAVESVGTANHRPAHEQIVQRAASL
ncbi:hypothetical protein IPM65_05095 [Candidatus Roizmanbacteria bacterium]|nr:MAG: hypothetical protein IPM65_05095 [Candidatus Roizmanbacteria bacterium]